MKQHSQETLNASFLHTLMTDIYVNRDEEYSSMKFPPAKKFFGDIDRDKNCHILSDRIHKLPRIQRLVLAIEEEVGDITVNSVWLIKKTMGDDGFQEWHQDFKHKITKQLLWISALSPQMNILLKFLWSTKMILWQFPRKRLISVLPVATSKVAHVTMKWSSYN